jgi:type I restriction enzyme S subunit
MIDGLCPYPEMKPTGLAWLGDVPAHWGVRRIKTLLKEIDNRSKMGDERLLSLRMRQGLVDHADAGGKLIPAESLVGYKIVETGQVVMNRMRAAAGLFGVAKVRGLVSPDYAVFEPKREAFNPYLLQAFQLPSLAAVFRAESKGLGTGESGFLRLYTDRFGPIPVPYPPLDEQRLIVRFLDWHGRQTAKLIRSKKKFIVLLNEQKQAIIHRAVTRGLEPNVKLKPSAIPWLGEVPEGWEVVPFKRRIGFQEGPGIMAADFRDHGVPLVRISGLHRDEATLDGCNFLDHRTVDQRWGHFRIRNGDYLLSSSASTGKICIATSVVEGAIPYTGIIRLWPISDTVSMPFMKYLIGAPQFQDQLDAVKSGVAIEHFGPTHLKRVLICLPPRPEQDAIARYILEATAKFSTTVASIEREIVLIQEFRTRLISDVVTGKLDVRALAKGLPDITELEPLDEPSDDIDLDDDIDTPENVEVAA